LLMVAAGRLLSTVGRGPIYGTERFTFGIFTLFDGLNIALLAMGLFGVSELLMLAEGGSRAAKPISQPSRLAELLPNRDDWRRSLTRLARNPERFGQGAIEGVAGPESANNAAAQSSLIPLLSLGIPANAVMAVIL